jgi:hypothetical protein
MTKPRNPRTKNINSILFNNITKDLVEPKPNFDAIINNYSL